MVKYKEFVANQLLGKTVRFMCDCIVKMDITGKVVDWAQTGSEIVYSVNTDGRIVKVAENTPKLRIDIID